MPSEFTAPQVLEAVRKSMAELHAASVHGAWQRTYRILEAEDRAEERRQLAGRQARLDRICKALNDENIPFEPLQPVPGAHIRISLDSWEKLLGIGWPS
jgi:hypothetical protein